MKGLLHRLLSLISTPAWAAPVNEQVGIVQMESPHDVSTTIDKLTAAIESKGMNVFGRVNHTANADNVGLSLRPTELLIFGNPKLGTPLMISAQTVALDLPQKMLAFQDESGKVFLCWDDPQYLKSRHGIIGCDETLQTISGALSNLAKAATSD